MQQHAPCSDGASTISDPDAQRSPRPDNSEDEQDGDPPDEPEFIDDEKKFRYTLEIKLEMVSTMLRVLSAEEVKELCAGKPFPCSNKGQRFTLAYERLWNVIREANKDPRKTEEIQYSTKKIEIRAVKEATKRWTMRFLEEGHIHAHKPHQAGYKMTDERMAALANIRAMILEGCDDGRGGKTLYR